MDCQGDVQMQGRHRGQQELPHGLIDSGAGDRLTEGGARGNAALLTSKCSTKNNFILFSVILEYIFSVAHHMRPAFIGIELYPLVFDKAP